MRKKQFDTVLAIVIFGLVLFGIVMISSVSVYESYHLTSDMAGRGLLDNPTNSFYLWRHIWRVALSIPIAIFMIYFPINIWKKSALWYKNVITENGFDFDI